LAAAPPASPIPTFNTRDIQETIKSVYDKKDGFLNGVYPLYKLIQTFFINITQKDVELFLQGSVVKQLTTQAVRSLKPIISPEKDGIWSMDLIDQERWQSQNKGYRYILTVVDIYTRYMCHTTAKQSYPIRPIFPP
jgi:hypothetical protein